MSHTSENLPTKVPEKGFYYHYKHDPAGSPYNHTYEVIGVGLHTEERTYTVLYRPLYQNDFMKFADYCSRPLEMFMETVEKEGKTIPRFRHITDPEIIAKLEAIKTKMYGN